MALGALFGATKIMYAAVRARTREIGTLRALGFGGVPVAVSVLLEAVLLALLGAALGALVAWLVFDGRVVYSGSVFRLHVSAPLAGLALAWGVVIALLGGMFPAIRAGKIVAAQVLRAV
jgi:putative ABC transport system permease protein